MPQLLSITEQPAAGSLHAAYRPVLFRITVTDATPPPVVYCDIYFGGVYYRTLAKSNYLSAGAGSSLWQFDIQLSCQEVLKKIIGARDGNDIIDSQLPYSAVTCKFRGSTYNADGFIEPVGPQPVQGTGGQDPVGGGGLTSNTFYVLNAVLQHEANQSLSAHLNTYKRGTWNSQAFPMTHRPLTRYKICHGQNDYFPFIFLDDTALKCLRLSYKLKGSAVYATTDTCGGGACVAVATSGTPNFPNGQVGVGYNYSFAISGTAPFTLSNVVKPDWMNIAFSGNTVVISGTPDTEGTDVSIFFRINNCAADFVEVADTFNVEAAPVCTPVTIQAAPLPDAEVGVPYDFSLGLEGSLPYTLQNVVKPSWMNIALLSGFGGIYYLRFTGTPPSGSQGTDIVVSFEMTNCSGTGFDAYSDTIDVFNNQTRFQNEVTNFSSGYQVEKQIDIVGSPGAEVTITVVNYINNNGGTLTFAGTVVTGTGETFVVTLDSSGLATVVAGIEGDPGALDTVILGKFQITAVTAGTIGTPDSYQISKVF